MFVLVYQSELTTVQHMTWVVSPKMFSETREATLALLVVILTLSQCHQPSTSVNDYATPLSTHSAAGPSEQSRQRKPWKQVIDAFARAPVEEPVQAPTNIHNFLLQSGKFAPDAHAKAPRPGCGACSSGGP